MILPNYRCTETSDFKSNEEFINRANSDTPHIQSVCSRVAEEEKTRVYLLT